MAKKTTKVSSFPNLVKNAFDEMVQTYTDLFNSGFIPAIPRSKKEICFKERNLTFNFCSSYLQNAGIRNGKDIFVWQEVDIMQVPGRRGRIDSVILDLREDVNVLLLIEAKRIADGGDKIDGKSVHKCEALQADMARLKDINLPGNPNGTWKISDELYTLINQYKPAIYRLALVDYWKWNGSKRSQTYKCMTNFEKCTGNDFIPINNDKFHDGLYFLNYCLDQIAPIQSPQTCCNHLLP